MIRCKESMVLTRLKNRYKIKCKNKTCLTVSHFQVISSYPECDLIDEKSKVQF